jgi:two-component system, chemotaxis family, sensor kinase CheA
MSTVRRLEQIHSESVERSGLREVVQYHGGVLPLVRVTDRLPNARTTSQTDVLDTVVCESSIGLVGLVVGHIEDVVPQPAAALPQPPSRHGVIASFVVDDRITELLDVELLIAEARVWSPA